MNRYLILDSSVVHTAKEVMPYIIFKIFKATILSCLCVLALSGIISGLVLSVTKSPAQKSQDLTVQSKIHATKMDFVQAEITARLALAYTPYDASLWAHMQSIEQKQTTSLRTAHRYKSFSALNTLNPSPKTP